MCLLASQKSPQVRPSYKPLEKITIQFYHLVLHLVEETWSCQSQLDHICTSHFNIFEDHSSTIRPTLFSAPHLMAMTVCLMPEWLGLAYWHFNKSMLVDMGFMIFSWEFWPTFPSLHSDGGMKERYVPRSFATTTRRGLSEEGCGDTAVAAGDFGVDRHLATLLGNYASARSVQRSKKSSGPLKTIWGWSLSAYPVPSGDRLQLLWSGEETGAKKVQYLPPS